LKLERTHYLPSLEGIVWDKEAGRPALSRPLQLSVRRARIGVQILQKPSDPQTKYDLFQRLNSGGSVATPQELRNCVMVMLNPEFFEFVRSLSENEDFHRLVRQSEASLLQQGNMELVTRFLVYLYVEYSKDLDVQEYLDQGIIELSESENDDLDQIRQTFEGTFRIIRQACGDDALKRYDGQSFKGRVGLTAFETIVLGVAHNLTAIEQQRRPDQFVARRIKSLWAEEEVTEFGRPGLRGTQRIQRSLPFGERWFQP
jgi:hypothetical protein